MYDVGSVDKAASELSKMLHSKPWYHRTSITYRAGIGTYLSVWYEGEARPEEIPGEFQGFNVVCNRVTKKHPCPFGSVKPDPKEGWGNKV